MHVFKAINICYDQHFYLWQFSHVLFLKLNPLFFPFFFLGNTFTWFKIEEFVLKRQQITFRNNCRCFRFGIFIKLTPGYTHRMDRNTCWNYIHVFTCYKWKKYGDSGEKEERKTYTDKLSDNALQNRVNKKSEAEQV